MFEGPKPGTSIRILLAEVPSLLAAMIKNALPSREMTVVEEVASSVGLADVVGEKEVNVVITSLRNNDVPRTYQQVLFTFPRIALLAISADVHRVDAYGRGVLLEPGVDELVQMIRSVVGEHTLTENGHVT